MTLEEAKKEVLRLIEQGANYREIAQIKFVINDRIKKFSIGEISKLKKEASGKVQPCVEHRDLALAFKLFTEGMTPTQVVMETELALDFVDQAHKKFLEWERKTVVPEWFVDNMFDFASNLSEPSELEDVSSNIKEIVAIYNIIQEFPVLCNVCDKPLPLSENMWKDASNYLVSRKWGHASCHDKNA